MKNGLGVAVGSGLVLVGLAVAPATARAQLREVSRSSPIVATVGGVEAQYQGSYEVVTPVPPVPTFTVAGDAATFEFPYTRGHLRAVATADITSTTTRFQDLVAIFDADGAGQIPTPNVAGCATTFSATCRTVFTTVDAPDADGLARRPDRVFFNTANLGALKPLLAPTLADADVAVLMDRVLAGVPTGTGTYVPRLGGIDRSTMAIVEPSPFIPQIAGVDRPTMIYVGALDGMVHAICANVLGPCLAAGQELWAFIPRTQLGALPLNKQRIDGSIKVADAFDDFDLVDPAVVRQYHTVLTVQTGSGDPALPGREPSILAIDVSNPADPIVLWERSTPASPDTVDQGVGIGLAMGPARVGTQIRNLTFAQTNNGGSSAASGYYLGAIDTSTGELVWAYRHTYPAPRNPANLPVPDSGIPGGPAIFDVAQDGLVSNVAVSSLYGDLWMFESDGGTPFADDPIFRFSADFQPVGAAPTVYFDQSTARFNAVVVSGSYVDPVAATWVQSAVAHFAVGVVIDPAITNVPMDEVTSGDYGGDRAFVITLATGSTVTAQAVVAGNELFIVADKTDVNLATYGEVPDTGSIQRYALSDGAAKGSLVTISGGASSVDATATGVVHVGDGAGAMKVDVGTTGGGGAFDALGKAVERGDTDNNARLLWLNG